jgi:hypothetical protein
MDIITFMVTVFYHTDNWLADKQVRQRGPQPILSDSEVLTMEIVGEFLSLDEVQAIYHYFQRHWADWFPAIRQVHRTTFVRQAANLWKVKEQLWQYVLSQIEYDPQVAIVDSFPVPICRFARAYRCRLFQAQAAYGHDEMAKQTFYGFRAHVRVCWPGVIVGLELTPANTHDVKAVLDLTEGTQGWILGDRNYWSPNTAEILSEQNLCLLTPHKSSKPQQRPWPLRLIQIRRRIETVFSQLVGRFQAKTVWARDLWHLCSRCLRKILAHSFAVFLAQREGLPSPLQFAQLLPS